MSRSPVAVALLNPRIDSQTRSWPVSRIWQSSSLHLFHGLILDSLLWWFLLFPWPVNIRLPQSLLTTPSSSGSDQKHLGFSPVIFDSLFTSIPHIQSNKKSCWLYLYVISCIPPLLTTLLSATFISFLDSCNHFLIGLSASASGPLQPIINQNDL